MLRLLKMLVLPLVAGSMVAGETPSKGCAGHVSYRALAGLLQPFLTPVGAKTSGPGVALRWMFPFTMTILCVVHSSTQNIRILEAGCWSLQKLISKSKRWQQESEQTAADCRNLHHCILQHILHDRITLNKQQN